MDSVPPQFLHYLYEYVEVGGGREGPVSRSALLNELREEFEDCPVDDWMSMLSGGDVYDLVGVSKQDGDLLFAVDGRRGEFRSVRQRGTTLSSNAAPFVPSGSGSAVTNNDLVSCTVCRKFVSLNDFPAHAASPEHKVAVEARTGRRPLAAPVSVAPPFGGVPHVAPTPAAQSAPPQVVPESTVRLPLPPPSLPSPKVVQPVQRLQPPPQPHPQTQPPSQKHLPIAKPATYWCGPCATNVDITLRAAHERCDLHRIAVRRAKQDEMNNRMRRAQMAREAAKQYAAAMASPEMIAQMAQMQAHGCVPGSVWCDFCQYYVPPWECAIHEDSVQHVYWYNYITEVERHFEQKMIAEAAPPTYLRQKATAPSPVQAAKNVGRPSPSVQPPHVEREPATAVTPSPPIQEQQQEEPPKPQVLPPAVPEKPPSPPPPAEQRASSPDPSTRACEPQVDQELPAPPKAAAPERPSPPELTGDDANIFTPIRRVTEQGEAQYRCRVCHVAVLAGELEFHKSTRSHFLNCEALLLEALYVDQPLWRCIMCRFDTRVPIEEHMKLATHIEKLAPKAVVEALVDAKGSGVDVTEAFRQPVLLDGKCLICYAYVHPDMESAHVTAPRHVNAMKRIFERHLTLPKHRTKFITLLNSFHKSVGHVTIKEQVLAHAPYNFCLACNVNIESECSHARRRDILTPTLRRFDPKYRGKPQADQWMMRRAASDVQHRPRTDEEWGGGGGGESESSDGDEPTVRSAPGSWVQKDDELKITPSHNSDTELRQ